MLVHHRIVEAAPPRLLFDFKLHANLPFDALGSDCVPISGKLIRAALYCAAVRLSVFRPSVLRPSHTDTTPPHCCAIHWRGAAPLPVRNDDSSPFVMKQIYSSFLYVRVVVVHKLEEGKSTKFGTKTCPAFDSLRHRCPASFSSP